MTKNKSKIILFIAFILRKWMYSMEKLKIFFLEKDY